jgi:hypothetical protein
MAMLKGDTRRLHVHATSFFQNDFSTPRIHIPQNNKFSNFASIETRVEQNPKEKVIIRTFLSVGLVLTMNSSKAVVS